MTPDEALTARALPSAAVDQSGSCQRISPAARAPCISHAHSRVAFLTIFSPDRILGRFRSAVLDRLTCWNALLCAIVMRPWNLWRAARHSLEWGHIDPGDVRGLAPVSVARACAGTPGSIIVRHDLELERVIGCAEANVSTQADQAHPQVWLPGPHGRSRWPRRAGAATAQGTSRAHRRGREQVHAESLGDSPSRCDQSGTLAGSREMAIS
jgi:hypothetical protein